MRQCWHGQFFQTTVCTLAIRRDLVCCHHSLGRGGFECHVSSCVRSVRYAGRILGDCGNCSGDMVRDRCDGRLEIELEMGHAVPVGFFGREFGVRRDLVSLRYTALC